jgi:hypothetical protein
MIKSSELVAEPLGVVTDTGPVLAPGGTIMMNMSELTTCTSGTDVAPMLTLIANSYPEPNTNRLIVSPTTTGGAGARMPVTHGTSRELLS